MGEITVDPEAMANEAAMQIAGATRRNIMLAGQLASALKRIAELQKELAEKEKSVGF